MLNLDLTNIAHITSDSREVGPQSIFVAISGVREDGKAYINDAINQGAKIIIVSKNSSELKDDRASFIEVENPRLALSFLANKLYQPKPKNIVAVTGTSGKTSVAFYYKQLMEMLGQKSASVGTLGVISSDYSKEGKLTTPSTADLHMILQELALNKIDYVALEASSHGLHQHRLDHVSLTAAAITNFSHEHLDYHKTMDEYFDAKMRLFSDILPQGASAIINADIDQYSKILTHCNNKKVISYGYNATDLKLNQVEQKPDHMLVELNNHSLKFPNIIGDFQAHNILCIIGLAMASGFSLDNILASVENLVSAPGRMQKVGQANVFIDYAHKVEALEKVLQVMRKSFTGKIIVVFGCGGDRDKEKRPLMGAIAAKYADIIIVTDDNPRSEDPAQIRREIITACPDSLEIGDREQAIATAIHSINSPNDAVLIAGKGHENYQIVGDKVLTFDDAEIAKKHLQF